MLRINDGNEGKRHEAFVNSFHFKRPFDTPQELSSPDPAARERRRTLSGSQTMLQTTAA